MKSDIEKCLMNKRQNKFPLSMACSGVVVQLTPLTSFYWLSSCKNSPLNNNFESY